MKILVTGGAGFIGSNIVKELVNHGDAPAVFDNLSSGHQDNLLRGVPFIRADVRDAAAVSSAAEGCSAIFHLAASVGNVRSIEDPATDSAVNLIGTLNVLEAARAHRIPRIVFSSSAGIFGELKTLPIAEDHPLNPDTPYGVSKLAAEKMCLAYNTLYGMKNVCLRYFNVYGVNQRCDVYGNVIPKFADRMLRNEPLVIFGDGEQTRDFVNVRDVVAANIAAQMSPQAKGVFNIGSGAPVTINELARQIQAAAGIVRSPVYAPARSGDVRHSAAEIRAAREALTFAPKVDLIEGLQEYVSWVSQETRP